MSEPATSEARFGTSGPWIDLGLTLPIFVLYHLGVVLLPVRNAADLVTQQLIQLADHNLLAYAGLTCSVGAVFVGILVLAGRGESLRWDRFALMATEGVLYALAMRLTATYVVGQISLAALPGALDGAFPGVVMSLGAGFYEEIAFRVLVFGFGARLVLVVFPLSGFAKPIFYVGWALASAALFSGWHYVGTLGDAFELRSFVFRWVCGIIFTLIYAYRGFAPAVWTHTLYDLWVLVF